MESMKTLIIMRGVAGSGKSTLARIIRDEATNRGMTAAIFSTDELFMIDGVYKFDPSKIGLYHSKNQVLATNAIDEGIEIVIIDNTNLTSKEILPYARAGIEHDYQVKMVEPLTEWKHDIKGLLSHGTHNVPEDRLKKMLERKEDTDDVGEWLATELACTYDVVTQTLHREWQYVEDE